MMNEFRSYGKIHRLGKEETEGILVGVCHVQEKIDGANTSCWLDETGEMKLASRTRVLGDEEFNGFVSYMKGHEGVKRLLADHPTWRLYMEWMVRHTIAYKETMYRKAYLFDIWTGDGYVPQDWIRTIGAQYSIDTVPHHGIFENPTVEQLMEYVGKSEFGDRGEGVVIKNPGFVNTFGDNVFAKIVTESFKEDNAVTFGGNNKHSETYWEVYVVNKYISLARVEKIMHKIQPLIDEKLDLKHIPRITGTVYHDMWQEEGFAIAKDIPKLDFRALQRIANKKTIQIYKDIIMDSISVADRKN